MGDKTLSEQLKEDHECGDFGKALSGYSERAAELESKVKQLEAELDRANTDAIFDFQHFISTKLAYVEMERAMNEGARGSGVSYNPFYNEDKRRLGEWVASYIESISPKEQ